MKAIKTLAICAITLFGTIPGIAQTANGSDSKAGKGKAQAPGHYTRKKMPGRMKSGQMTAKAESKSGNQKQPNIAVKGAGVPQDTSK